jgi:hypothetical protein
MQLPAESQKIKCDIIFPATEKHVAKVGSEDTFLSALGLGEGGCPWRAALV